jgi:hypothetical protein
MNAVSRNSKYYAVLHRVGNEAQDSAAAMGQYCEQFAADFPKTGLPVDFR